MISKKKSPKLVKPDCEVRIFQFMSYITNGNINYYKEENGVGEKFFMVMTVNLPSMQEMHENSRSRLKKGCVVTVFFSHLQASCDVVKHRSVKPKGMMETNFGNMSSVKYRVPYCDHRMKPMVKALKSSTVQTIDSDNDNSFNRKK